MRKYKLFNLKDYNAYKLESVCSKAYFPESESDIIDLYKIANRKKHVIGNGNNIILSKEYYDEDFIILTNCFDKINIIADVIEIESGATMLQLSEVALSKSLTGAEIFYDIPSSVGGAIVMNAGAGGEETKDILAKVRYLDTKTLQIHEITQSEINFEYRNSFFQKYPHTLILKAWFQLSKGNAEEIKSKMEKTKKTRWEKQPREFPNCGSVFKRPKGYFVGQLMDELNLKGTQIGGAKISEKHGGFIINTGGATGEDVIQLINLVQNSVRKTYGIELEVEQRII